MIFGKSISLLTNFLDKKYSELKDKLGDMAEEDATLVQDEVDTMEALTSLGYGQKEVRDVLQKIPKSVAGPQDRIKEALKLLN